MTNRYRRIFAAAPLLALMGPLAGTLGATITVQLNPSLPPPQPVGTTITWQAIASDTNPGPLVYRFSLKPSGGTTFQIVRDYHPSSVFEWTPTQREGNFNIQVAVLNQSTNETLPFTVSFQVTSRVTTAPVVTATPHPLVALYSAPPCAPGKAMRVRFQRADLSSLIDSTTFKQCTGISSMNFYVAGMLPGTIHNIWHEIWDGSVLTPGPTLQFTTGAVPSTLHFPAISTVVAPNAQTALGQDVLLHDYSSAAGQLFPVTATDLKGRVIWYYARAADPGQEARFFHRLLTGGTILIVMNDPTLPLKQFQLLREIDLAGNTIRETNIVQVSNQLIARGDQAIQAFHHDAVRLPNGHTLVLGSQERIFPAGTQGSAGPVDIIGDLVIELDENLQVTWVWNSFDHLDINRAAVLGETCTPGQGGCPPLALSTIANDWTHSNGIVYIPNDGNILVSMRHQDWVIKINYTNGLGTGNILWRLGNGGDFTIVSSDPWPWFSHQHNPGYDLGDARTLSVYDNGNTRVAQLPGTTQNSRGQVLDVNESTRTVTPILNADLGVYSLALGSAERLANGNYHFDSGIVNPGPNVFAQATEVLPSGAINFILQSSGALTYRSYRYQNLYFGLSR